MPFCLPGSGQMRARCTMNAWKKMLLAVAAAGVLAFSPIGASTAQAQYGYYYGPGYGVGVNVGNGYGYFGRTWTGYPVVYPPVYTAPYYGPSYYPSYYGGGYYPYGTYVPFYNFYHIPGVSRW